MSSALSLKRLQQVDSKLDQLESELGRIEAELANDGDVRTAQAGYAAAEEVLKDAERSRRDMEVQAAGVRSKMQQAEASLYGGSVRNPKELQDLQADVASLRKHLSNLEETELQCMERVEAAEMSLRNAGDGLSEVLEKTRMNTGRLKERQTELLGAREDLRSERLAAAQPIPVDHLAAYEKLRQSRRGVAVAAVSDNACSACGTTLTAALQQAARHANELVLCPSCGRILYGD